MLSAFLMIGLLSPFDTIANYIKDYGSLTPSRSFLIEVGSALRVRQLRSAMFGEREWSAKLPSKTMSRILGSWLEGVRQVVWSKRLR